jgi:hypothetical protein
MKKQLHHIFHDLICDWAGQTGMLEQASDGVVPEMTDYFGTTTEAFSLPQIADRVETSDWQWRSVTFNEVFDGTFFYYLPPSWAIIQVDGRSAVLAENDLTRQSLFVLPRQSLQRLLSQVLERVEVLAFSYDRLSLPSYDRWVFVMREADESYWIWAIYASGEWCVLTKADGDTPTMLATQLAAILGSNPWYGWIQASQQ